MGRSQPHFILEGASRFDIQQGKAGKNSTFSCLALDGGRLLKVSLRLQKGEGGTHWDPQLLRGQGQASQRCCAWPAPAQPYTLQVGSAMVCRAFGVRSDQSRGENQHKV